MKTMLLCFLIIGCQNQQLEQDFFFKQPAATRVERMRQLSLEDQYKIFRYGNDKIEPPATALAHPIAERGKLIIPFLIKELKTHKDTYTVRDILVIVETMLYDKTYDVRTDPALMQTLDESVSSMKNADWRPICEKTLRRIKESN